MKKTVAKTETSEVAKTADITFVLVNNCKKLDYWQSIAPANCARDRDLYKDDTLQPLYTDKDIEAVEGFLAEISSKYKLPEYVVSLRHKYILEQLKSFAESSPEGQVLILGSGFSTYAARKHQGKYEKLQYFEVDFPQVLERKEELYQQHHITPNATYIKHSYTQDDFIDTLTQAGFDTARDTLVIWEGNFMYLERPVFEAVTECLFQTLTGKLRVTFDSFSKELVEDTTGMPHLTRFVETMAKRNHGFVQGSSPEGVKALAGKTGERTWVEHLNLNDLVRRYDLATGLEDGAHAAVSTLSRG